MKGWIPQFAFQEWISNSHSMPSSYKDGWPLISPFQITLQKKEWSPFQIDHCCVKNFHFSDRNRETAFRYYPVYFPLCKRSKHYFYIWNLRPIRGGHVSEKNVHHPFQDLRWPSSPLVWKQTPLDQGGLRFATCIVHTTILLYTACTR